MYSLSRIIIYNIVITTIIYKYTQNSLCHIPLFKKKLHKKIVAGSYLLIFDLCFSLNGQLNDSHIGSYEEGSNNKKNETENYKAEAVK